MSIGWFGEVQVKNKVSFCKLLFFIHRYYYILGFATFCELLSCWHALFPKQKNENILKDAPGGASLVMSGYHPTGVELIALGYKYNKKLLRKWIFVIKNSGSTNGSNNRKVIYAEVLSRNIEKNGKFIQGRGNLGWESILWLIKIIQQVLHQFHLSSIHLLTHGVSCLLQQVWVRAIYFNKNSDLFHFHSKSWLNSKQGIIQK